MTRRRPKQLLSEIEQEVLFLKAACDIIDSMVNREMLAVHDSPAGSTILFTTGTHQRLFNILLLDFLSDADDRLPVNHISFLGALRQIETHPRFDVDGSVSPLRIAVRSCFDWLNQSVPVDVWFSSLGKEAVVRLPRLTYLKMCGNIAKHDPLRLGSVARDLQDALAASGVTVDRDDALLALDDFYQRFHTDILNYHGSTIVALLNDIRWGIHEYLLPEFQRSYSTEGCEPPMYRYTYPAVVTGKFPRERYWDLMNAVRGQPILPRFQVSESFRKRY
jgi:hypothetical protein